MKKIFNLNSFVNKDKIFGSPEVRTIVEMGVDLTESYIAKKHTDTVKVYGLDLAQKDGEYALLNAAFQKALFSYVFDLEDFEMTPENLSRFKKPNPLKMSERERYYEIVTAVETVVTPSVTEAFTGSYNEVKNIGWGDTAEFEVESNEILIAKKHAEGVPFGASQKLYRDNKTINTESLNITFDTDWYKIASGKEDFGQMFFKASQGFVNYFTYQAYLQLVALAGQIPASYTFVGATTENLDLCTMAVSAANNNVPVSIIGTLPMLRLVVPTNDFFKMSLGEEWVKMGYIGVHANSPLVKMDNLLNPTTVNSNNVAATPSFLMSNTQLFVLPFVGRKPIKTVFEGDMFAINLTEIQTADKKERASLTYKAGTDYVYDEIIGIVNKQ